MPLLPANFRDQLTSGADDADRMSDWPVASWQALRDCGALGWAIPTEFGGTGLGPVELLDGLEEIGAACMTTAFALSQREAAVRQLLKGPVYLQEMYLPHLATGDAFLTVGLSQLTTSRQHLGPALRASPLPTGGYQLDGEIPWVTGADQATAIIAGATLADSTPILVVIPTARLAGMIGPTLDLSALVGSRTSHIRSDGVCIEQEFILAGPTENVMGKVGGGGLETSCLAIGLAAAAQSYVRQEAESRPYLQQSANQFETAVQNARRRLHEFALTNADPQQKLALRLDCTKLVLRATQAALMVAKGAGFVAPHAAQRWARQALFFLVWSCPRPVADGLLAELASFH